MRLREVFQQPQKQVLREGIAHPEDMIINGVVAKDSAGKNYYETQPGAEAANRAIDSIAQIETDPETISVKWDGFPAVVFGRDDKGNFVFVDKHQFDKAAKGKAELTTIEEYDKARGANRTNLWQAEKILRPAVEATVPSVNDKYWMGDLMWTGSPKEDGNTWVFKPNTVEYRVNKQGDLGERISNSRAGIAVHTFYPGLNASDQALTGLEGLDPNGAVTYLTGEMKDKPQVSIDQKQIEQARKIVNQHAGAVDKFIQDLTQMKAKAVITAMGPFITRMLEQDDIKNNIVPRFLEFLEDRLSDSMKKKMLGDDQNGWLYAQDGGGPGLLGIWTMWAAVTDLKMQVKTQIDDQQQGSEVEAIIDGDPAHEGYVFGQGSEKIKLVDRLGFSKANFSKHTVPDEEAAEKAEMDKAAFCFGRMNPPTIGHKKLMQSTIAAGGANSYIFVSSKTDSKTDPLDPEVKKAFIKQIYPSMASYVIDDFVKTPIEAANYLYDKGFRNMTFVAGSDRLGDAKGSLEKILTSWNSGPVRSTDYARGENGREYVNLEFESSGERDPDAGDVSGISGSLARKLAAEGNESGFEKATGVDSRTRVGGRTLYTATREGMGIRDAETEEIQMNQPELKEYVSHLENIIGDRLNEMTETNQQGLEDKIEQVIFSEISTDDDVNLDLNDRDIAQIAQAAQKGDFTAVANIIGEGVSFNFDDDGTQYALEVQSSTEQQIDDVVESIKVVMQQSESTFEDEDFDDEEGEEEPVNKGFSQSPMFDQLGKVLDSQDSPKPVNTVTTDDGETFEVNQDQARALRLLATTEKVKPDVKQEFLRDLQTSQGLSDYLDQSDYHEMAHLFVKRYLH